MTLFGDMTWLRADSLDALVRSIKSQWSTVRDRLALPEMKDEPGIDITVEGLPRLAALVARLTTEDSDALLLILLPSISTVDRHGCSKRKPKETRRV